MIDTEETTLPPPSSVIPIVELLRDGQDVIVQVLKEPIGTKGARLTTHISIPSRYLVLLPHSKVVGVSVRIEDEAERARLKSVVTDLAVQYGCYGYIVRTNAEGQLLMCLPRTSPICRESGVWWSDVGVNCLRAASSMRT